MTGSEYAHAIPTAPDDVFTAVSNERRRRVILSLTQSDDAVTVSELAVELAAMEELIDPSEVTSKQRTRIYISLIQNHLGQLDSLGVVAYDSRAKQVCPTDATEPVAQHIRKIMTACYTPEEVSA